MWQVLDIKLQAGVKDTDTTVGSKVCMLTPKHTTRDIQYRYTLTPPRPPLQHTLLQDLTFKQGSLGLLSQEMNCQKALSGHILTPGLHSKCLKERPDEASVTAAGLTALLSHCIGVDRQTAP